MPNRRRAPALDRATVRRFWVVVLAALCVVVAAQAGPWQPAQQVVAEVEDRGPGEAPTLPPEEAPPDLERPLPQLGEADPGLVWIRSVLVVATTAVLLFLLVRWGLRQRLPVRPPPPEPVELPPPVAAPRTDPEPDLQVMQDGARAAEERLRAAATPVDAVIAAWVALEDAAARSGVARERSATATEFTLQVLDRTPADPAAARTLLALYLRARFDDQPLTDDDVEVAAGAARALVDTVDDPGRRWRAGPPAPRPAGGGA